MAKKLKLTDQRTTFKPFTHPEFYDDWLTHESMHWIHTEVSLLPDIQDWQNNLTEKEKTFLTNVFRFFTQSDCYHPDTELLTVTGWKNITKITKNDHIATFNPNTKTINYNSINEYIEKQYNGKLFHLTDESHETYQCVTETHKVGFEHDNKFSSKLAKDFIAYQGVKILTSAPKIGSIDKLTAFDRLRIAFQADESVKSDVNGEKLGHIPHRFSFNNQRKIDRLKQILDSGNFEYEYINKETNDDSGEFYIKGLIEKLDKDFSWVDLENVSQNWCIEFLEELSHWDSHIQKDGHIVYSNTNKNAVELARILCIFSGCQHNFSVIADNRSENNDVYTLYYNLNKKGMVDGQAIKRSSFTENYEGNVYCVSVDDGFLVTKFNNSVAISGNCDVAGGYVNNYLPIFKQPELRMMLLGFAAREAIHIAAYSHLIETLGMPESTYTEFLEYKEMKDKHDYIESFVGLDAKHIAQQIALFSAFTEGMQLFSSFIMLLNFPRRGKMKGMGQIISWSILDEQIHCESMIKVFRIFIEENRHIWKDELKSELYSIAEKMVELEDAFIDICYKMGECDGLDINDLKKYIRYICDRRLISMGLKGIYKVKKNPLPWVDEMISAPAHTNFFENRAVAYAKGALTGTWGDVWGSNE